METAIPFGPGLRLRARGIIPWTGSGLDGEKDQLYLVSEQFDWLWYNMKYKPFWRETHANIHTRHMDRIDEILSTASSHLDFLAMAYYPYAYRKERGFGYEDWIEEEQVEREWRTICDATKRHNSPG